jgi:hypothetical protein
VSTSTVLAVHAVTAGFFGHAVILTVSAIIGGIAAAFALIDIHKKEVGRRAMIWAGIAGFCLATVPLSFVAGAAGIYLGAACLVAAAVLGYHCLVDMRDGSPERLEGPVTAAVLGIAIRGLGGNVTYLRSFSPAQDALVAGLIVLGWAIVGMKRGKAPRFTAVCAGVAGICLAPLPLSYVRGPVGGGLALACLFLFFVAGYWLWHDLKGNDPHRIITPLVAAVTGVALMGAPTHLADVGALIRNGGAHVVTTVAHDPVPHFPHHPRHHHH